MPVKDEYIRVTDPVHFRTCRLCTGGFVTMKHYRPHTLGDDCWCIPRMPDGRPRYENATCWIAASFGVTE